MTDLATLIAMADTDEVVRLRLLVVVADSLERDGLPNFAGVVRQGARRIAELPVEATRSDHCPGCDAPILQPRTGRRPRTARRASVPRSRRVRFALRVMNSTATKGACIIAGGGEGSDGCGEQRRYVFC
jgi:hypothetical protein